MPYYYDVSGAHTTNATPNTETTHLWVKTIAEQGPVELTQILATARFGTAGGASARVKTNSGTVASGGSAQTPAPRRPNNPAASSVWANDGSAITPGTTLTIRASLGMAQTGGTGGWTATEPDDRIEMRPNGVNPVDAEFTSLAASATVPFDLTVEFSEA